MFDVTREQIESGQVTIKTTGTGKNLRVDIETPRFDPLTGEPDTPIVQPVHLWQLQERRDQLSVELDTVNALIGAATK